MGKITEPDFNTNLASLLRKKHPEWSKGECIEAEKVGLIKNQSNLCLDILVRHAGGVPVVIETEFNPARTVEKDATDRLGLPLVNSNDRIEQAIALRIPENLRQVNQGKMRNEILKSEFEFCVFSLNKESLEFPHRWPNRGWISGNLDSLADLVELTALSDDVLDKCLNELDMLISDASTMLRQSYADRRDVLNKIAESLHQEDCEQTTCMAMAIVLNAIMFHKNLIGISGIKSFEEIWKPTSENRFNKRQLFDHWDHIVRKVNYFPIFSIALEILEPLDDKSKEILEVLFSAADRLQELGATSRHDLCGRMFQRLIIDRSYLATFYTLPSSAALLAEMAIDRLDIDWSNSNDIDSLRIADFACGTGALLNASMHSVLSKFNRTGGDGSKIHKNLVEEVIIGADIMPAATHLTASMIAGVYPKNKFDHTSIYTLPYGEVNDDLSIRNVSIGSLELLDSQPVFSVFDKGDRKLTAVKGDDAKADLSEKVPDYSCDLVIMNPPFTRPTKRDGHNRGKPVPSFAGLKTTDQEQEMMTKRLKKLKTKDMVGHGNAGLASNFFDIAHKKVKLNNGVIALVIPATFLKGGAWNEMLNCVQSNYTDIIVFSITSSEKGDSARAFSADTNIAEILLVATRMKNNGNEKNPIKYVNLKERPKSILESVLIAKKLINGSDSPIISIGDSVVAEISTSSGGSIYEDVVLAASELSNGKLMLPHLKKTIQIPTTPISSIGKVGLYHLDIIGPEKNNEGIPRGPFDKISPPINKSPTYPMLWAHNSDAEKKLIVDFDSEGRKREKCEEKALSVWNRTKSKLHFSLNFRLNSQPLAACLTKEETIGGSAWPNVILNDENWDIPVLLWANTTLGLLLYWAQGSHQIKGRAILTKTTLANLVVLDARKLSQSQLDQANEIFEIIKQKEFLPANEAYHDSTRQLLDHYVLVDILGIPDDAVKNNLKILRDQWSDEPTVHGGKSTAPN